MITNDLAGSSKVWIYQSSRKFTDDEVNEIKMLGANFINEWNAHGSKLTASLDLLYNYFIVLMVDENLAKASGCSIDSSVAFIKKIEQQFNVELLNRMNVAYIANDTIETTALSQLQQLINENKIDLDTIVFNNLVATKTDFISSWKTPIKNSWHSKMVSA